MLDQPPSRAQCIEFNADDYALHQASYLPYPKLLTLYQRSATVCPDYFQGSTALDAHAREVFGTIRAGSLTSLLFDNIEERYVSYLQQRNLLQNYLLSPQGDADRQSNSLSVTHVAKWMEISNHWADFLAFDAEQLQHRLEWEATAPERERQRLQAMAAAAAAEGARKQAQSEAEKKARAEAHQERLAYLATPGAIDECVKRVSKSEPPGIVVGSSADRARVDEFKQQKILDDCKVSVAEELENAQQWSPNMTVEEEAKQSRIHYLSSQAAIDDCVRKMNDQPHWPYGKPTPSGRPTMLTGQDLVEWRKNLKQQILENCKAEAARR